MKSMLGGQQAPADYAPLPGGDFDDLGANPRARARRASGHKLTRRLAHAFYLRWASRRRCRGALGMSRPPTPPRATTDSPRATSASNRRRAKSSGSPSRAPTPPICRVRFQRFSLRRVLSRSPPRTNPLPSSDAIRQPDFEAESMSTSTSMHPPPSQLHEGHSLIASCPKCASQLVIPPGVPTVACGSCGQAISPVVNGGYPGGGMYPGAGAPPPPQMPPPPHGNGHGHGGQMVKCPLCAALLQQPPGASLAICGGCHQVIAMPGGGSGGPAGGHPEPPPLIACPSCSMRLQPPPGAPLVACGGCRQVMQVPGVAG